MMKTYLIVIVFALIFAGCAKKTAPADTENYSVDSVEQAYQGFQEKQLPFRTFSTDVRTRYEDEDKSLTIKTEIRIEKDKRIWLSGRFLGFEGVRALITPDSVKVINRLEKTYSLEPIETIEELTKLPVNFYTFQNMIIGDLLVFNTQNTTIEDKDASIRLTTQQENLINTILLNKANLQLQQQVLRDEVSNQTMNVTYDDAENVAGGSFMTTRRIHANSGNDQVAIDLRFSDVKINPELSFPFSISDRYEREEY